MPIATPNSLSYELIEIIKSKINSLSPELYDLSQSIHSQPETAFEEYHAHRVLTNFMESKGFKVTRHAYGLRTAWRAELEVGTGGPIIGYNSECEFYG
jgi:metal-dependent amidase/aminoacylase/carboxypeptidase family protein